eukprot:s5030_g5.t1
MANPSLDALRACFKDARVPDELTEYAITTVGLQSVDDFVNLVTVAGYESELKEVLVEPCAATRGNVIALSRIRAAWRAGRAMTLKSDLKRQSAGTVELEPMITQWKRKYHLALSVHLQPSDALLGRLYRELTRCTPTLLPIAKIRSLAFCNRSQAQERKISLSGQVSIRVDNDVSEMPVANVFQYYQGLRILANGLSIVGNTQVESKAKPGEKCTAV